MGGLRLWGYVHNFITWIDPLGLVKGDVVKSLNSETGAMDVDNVVVRVPYPKPKR